MIVYLAEEGHVAALDSTPRQGWILFSTDFGKAEAKVMVEKQFTDQGYPELYAFAGNAKPMQRSVFPEEVTNVISSLQNGRAPDPDSINSELLKNVSNIIAKLI